MKKNKPLWLGLDTSVYTCSVALILDNNELTYKKSVLPIKPGERDLKQAVALFKHLKRLPELIHEYTQEYDFNELKGICVSASPRPINTSYMPVFEGGKAIGNIIASILDIPILEVSHQENHIEAVVEGSKIDLSELKDLFLTVHYSGGTSEILYACLKDKGYEVNRVPGSLDAMAGQLIDRTGIRLGCSFPAGAELEKLALRAENKDVYIPNRLENRDLRFSGQVNYVNNLIDKGLPGEEIAYGLFRMIGETLYKSIFNLLCKDSFHVIVFSGGVMSNSIIREILTEKLKDSNLKLYFAPTEYSSDNAIGNASLARRILGG